MAASDVKLVFSKESGTKTGATVSDKYQIQLKNVFSVAKIITSVREIIPESFYPFLLVFQVFFNFAMTKWLYRVIC